MAYARRLTKDELQEAGITEITKDCRMFRGDKEIFPSWSCHNKDPYLVISIYDLDENGNKIKKDITRQFKYTKKDGSETVYAPVDTYNYKCRTIGLHRAMWAWHYGEVPEGMVVDHKDNQHSKLEDYRLENLQLLTQKENVVKEREESTREEKCLMKKPRSFYEDKLAKYLEKYEQAKLDKNAELVHKLRSNVAQTRARLRYWDAHKDEYEEYLKFQKAETVRRSDKSKRQRERALFKAWADFFKDKGNKTMWHECLRCYNNYDKLTEIAVTNAFETLERTFGNQV